MFDLNDELVSLSNEIKISLIGRVARTRLSAEGGLKGVNGGLALRLDVIENSCCVHRPGSLLSYLRGDARVLQASVAMDHGVVGQESVVSRCDVIASRELSTVGPALLALVVDSHVDRD